MPVLGAFGTPEIRVEIAFDSGYSTPAADRTWTDVSEWVEGEQGIPITRGRGDELEAIDPSQMSVTLDNRDGRFTPGNTASPYYPNVKKGRPIRVSVIYDADAQPRFTGYVDAWPVVWPDGTHRRSSVTITATSRRARMGASAPLESAIRTEYAADQPSDYWVMDDIGGVVGGINNDQVLFLNWYRNGRNMATAGSRRAQIILQDQAKPGPVDENSMPKFPSGTTGDRECYAYAQIAPIDSTAGATVEAVVRINLRAFASNAVPMVTLFSADGSRIADFSLAWSREFGAVFDLGADLNYHDFVTPANNQFPVQALTTPETQQLTDGELHHIAFTLSNESIRGFLDGVSIGTATFTPPATMVGTPFTSIMVAGAQLQADLWVGHLATYDKVLSNARILAHADAALASDETFAERALRVAGEVGVAADEVFVEATGTTLTAQGQAGRSAVEILDEMTTTEGGVLYDAKDGTLHLDARTHRYNATVVATLDAGLDEIGADFTSVLDDRYLTNEMEVANGDESLTVTSTNHASVDEYGLYRKATKFVTQDMQQITAFTHWTATVYGEPAPRVSQVSVDLVNIEPALRDSVLDVDIGSRLSLTGLPAQAPASTLSLFAEGYAETISTLAHTITFNTTPDLFGSPFILDTSVLDGSDVLVY